jgi:hypothetical protein
MALIELTSNLSVKAGQRNTTENGTFRVRQGNTRNSNQMKTN